MYTLSNRRQLSKTYRLIQSSTIGWLYELHLVDIQKYFLLAPSASVAAGKTLKTGGTLVVGQAQSSPGVAAASYSGDRIRIDELRLWS